MPHYFTLDHFYAIGRRDYCAGKYFPPAGPDDDPHVRAYQDGFNCADRLRHVLPEDIIGDRDVPASLVIDVEHTDWLDRATGEGRR